MGIIKNLKYFHLLGGKVTEIENVAIHGLDFCDENAVFVCDLVSRLVSLVAIDLVWNFRFLLDLESIDMHDRYSHSLSL